MTQPAANDIARDTYQKISAAVRSQRDFSIELHCTNQACLDQTMLFVSRAETARILDDLHSIGHVYFCPVCGANATVARVETHLVQ